jgi:hypothetical protein
MNLLFRLLLTVNATSLLVIVFMVQKGYTLGCLLPNYTCLIALPPIVVSFGSYLLYVAVPLVLTWLSILLCTKLGKDEFKKGDIISIKYANNCFLPSYLGYFFVALSVDKCETFLFVYIMLLIFTFLSQALYFNPLFLIFNYMFYNIKTKNGAEIFLISRKNYKTPKEIEIKKVYRINNYTFIEQE